MRPDSNSKYMLAIVVNLDDEKANPRNEERIQIRIPSIHGPSDPGQLPPEVDATKVIVDDMYLPWAQICYPVGTKDPDKHSFFEEGEIVYVAFAQDQPKNPIIIGTLGKMVEE